MISMRSAGNGGNLCSLISVSRQLLDRYHALIGSCQSQQDYQQEGIPHYKEAIPTLHLED